MPPVDDARGNRFRLGEAEAMGSGCGTYDLALLPT
jgi:hypothetical protein